MLSPWRSAAEASSVEVSMARIVGMALFYRQPCAFRWTTPQFDGLRIQLARLFHLRFSPMRELACRSPSPILCRT